MSLFRKRGRSALDYDWDPEQRITIRNTTAHNILLDLPTGHFRLDAGRSFRMTPDIVNTPQVQQLLDAGEISLITDH